MSERGPIFDAAREAYEAAQQRLLALTETPDYTVTVDDYRAKLKRALQDQRKAHKKVREAWG